MALTIAIYRHHKHLCALAVQASARENKSELRDRLLVQSTSIERAPVHGLTSLSGTTAVGPGPSINIERRGSPRGALCRKYAHSLLSCVCVCASMLCRIEVKRQVLPAHKGPSGLRPCPYHFVGILRIKPIRTNSPQAFHTVHRMKSYIEFVIVWKSGKSSQELAKARSHEYCLVLYSSVLTIAGIMSIQPSSLFVS
jgi:hypothetical protein